MVEVTCPKICSDMQLSDSIQHPSESQSIGKVAIRYLMVKRNLDVSTAITTASITIRAAIAFEACFQEVEN